MSDLSRRWDEPLLAQSRRLAGEYSPERLRRRLEFLIQQDHSDTDVLLRGPNFLEDLAILVDDGAISFEIVRKSLGSGIEDDWNHWEPTVRWLRGDEKYDLIYENWEVLAKRMRDELARLGDVPGVTDSVPESGQASGTDSLGDPSAPYVAATDAEPNAFNPQVMRVLLQPRFTLIVAFACRQSGQRPDVAVAHRRHPRRPLVGLAAGGRLRDEAVSSPTRSGIRLLDPWRRRDG